ncbi:hypothetical protein I3679_014270 [Proteus mirabilis]|uniref:Uncharacterized protein n=1 Tax=Proteus mirabilis TaxID=584 RepID=A0ABD5LU42_PROMI
MPEFIFLSHEVMMEVLKITINNKKEEVTQDNNKDSFIKQANHEDILFFNRLKINLMMKSLQITKLRLVRY